MKLKQVFIEAGQKEILDNKSGSVMVGKLMKKDRILQTKENNKLCKSSREETIRDSTFHSLQDKYENGYS